jgi:hypothetical protein
MGFSRSSERTPLERKYPRAAKEWAWQWVVPASRFYLDRAR